MTASLLPPNATPLALALESVLAVDDRLTGIEAITGAKLDAPDSFLPWLLWEYGLGELQAYLPDPRQAIRDGIAWQRLRGTPAALKIALGWRGFDGMEIEEHGPGFGFAGFQIDPGTVPGAGAVTDIIALAGLAAPARSRLVRLYHDLDLRAAHYDTPLDRRCLYDDWSGIDLDGVRQSFRTHYAYAGTGDAPAGAAGAVTVWGAWHHADPLRRWDVTLWDGAMDAAVVAPALVSIEAWHGPDTTAASPRPAWWTLSRAMAADGVAYDSVDGVYDGYAVMVSDAPAEQYDDARYDAATTWRWLAADDREVDYYGAALPELEPAPLVLAGVTVTGIHFPEAPTAGVLASDSTAGIVFPAAASWGAGPWLRQPWGNTSGAFKQEFMA